MPTENSKSLRKAKPVMTYYGAKETRAIVPHVRNNTITIAEEIAEEKYGFRPAEGCLSIPAQLCLRIYPQSRTVIEHYGPRWRGRAHVSCRWLQT